LSKGVLDQKKAKTKEYNSFAEKKRSHGQLNKVKKIKQERFCVFPFVKEHLLFQNIGRRFTCIEVRQNNIMPIMPVSVEYLKFKHPQILLTTFQHLYLICTISPKNGSRIWYLILNAGLGRNLKTGWT
jgi:hypothetical protein